MQDNSENENSPILQLDEDGIIVSLNKDVCELTGYGETELIGNKITKLFPNNKNDIIITGETNHFISQLTKNDGKNITVVSISSRFYKKNSYFFYLTLFDISLMSTQVDNGQLTTLRLLSGYIAHDFNNILSGIMGSLSLLRENNFTEEEFSLILDNAETGAEKAKILVSKMLAFSNAEITLKIDENFKQHQTQIAIKKQKQCNNKILLMEDNALVASVSTSLLKALGYCSVDVVKKNDEAIELYKHQIKTCDPYKAVILDLNLTGGLGGLATVKFLTEIDMNVTAIISSGYHNDEVMLNYKKYGFKSALKKPYNIRELFESLEEAFEIKE